MRKTTEVAREITKVAAQMRYTIKPNQVCVSRWENGETAPSEQHRLALARIAARREETEHLAELFRAPVSAWRLVGDVKFGFPNDK